MSSRKMILDATTDLSALVAVAVTNAFALLVAVYAAVNISGGHVNPGSCSRWRLGVILVFLWLFFYWISQLVGFVTACLFLKVTTVSQHVLVHEIPQEMIRFGAFILEWVMTFGLVYTVYAAKDPRRGPLAAIGPLAIGFIVGANVLASGPFTGGSMTPAYSFRSALVKGSFKNHVVYWVGPLIGAPLAGILYDNVVFPVQVPSIVDGVGV
ncbi:hypothetical protein ACSBR2_022308 [Camellia fascicularis]